MPEFIRDPSDFTIQDWADTIIRRAPVRHDRSHSNGLVYEAQWNSQAGYGFTLSKAGHGKDVNYRLEVVEPKHTRAGERFSYRPPHPLPIYCDENWHRKAPQQDPFKVARWMLDYLQTAPVSPAAGRSVAAVDTSFWELAGIFGVTQPRTQWVILAYRQALENDSTITSMVRRHAVRSLLNQQLGLVGPYVDSALKIAAELPAAAFTDPAND